MADKTEEKPKATQDEAEAPERSAPDRSKSSYRPAASAVPVAGGAQGGSGVQRSHLRDRKTWLKKRKRAGRTWIERKVASLEYCPAKRRVD